MDGNEPIHHLDSPDNRSVRIIFDLEQSEQKLTFKSATLVKWGLDRCHPYNLNLELFALTTVSMYVMFLTPNIFGCKDQVAADNLQTTKVKYQHPGSLFVLIFNHFLN